MLFIASNNFSLIGFLHVVGQDHQDGDHPDAASGPQGRPYSQPINILPTHKRSRSGHDFSVASDSLPEGDSASSSYHSTGASMVQILTVALHYSLSFLFLCNDSAGLSLRGHLSLIQGIVLVDVQQLHL